MLKQLIKYIFWISIIICSCVFIWSYVAISFYITSGIIGTLLGLLIGVFTALNYDRDNAIFYWMAAGFATLFGYYTGKYIIFEYYAGLIDIEANLSIAQAIFNIVNATDSSTIAEFAKNHILQFDIFDFLWPTTSFVLALYHARKVVTHKQRYNKLKKKLKK